MGRERKEKSIKLEGIEKCAQKTAKVFFYFLSVFVCEAAAEG
jgi:hypothetical protein